MSQGREAGSRLDRLPVELVDRLTKPFAWFLRIEALGGGILLLFTVAALVLSNSPWAHPFLSAWELPVGIRIGSFEFARSSREWINDGLMTFFFFVVALELKRELVRGELRSPRMAAFSIAAALGGMLVPAALYLTLQLGREGVAGVVLGLLTPTGTWVSDDRLQAILGRVVPEPSEDHRSDMAEGRRAWRLTEVAIRETLSPVERLEMMLHPWVSFAIMPLFAFANAGMPLSSADVGSPVTSAVFVGFTIGKPVGIVTFGWLAVRSGLASRPPDMGWGMLAGAGLLAGIGFTMALFIADLAFDDSLINAAKLGILSASVASAAAGLAVLAWATRGKPVSLR
ncbi:MAG: Na+/H+ antiporter NhaA [Gemmatimonadales bacterium]